jgi:hypothetical protein
MSSLRPATVIATLYQLLGGSLSSPAEPDGPGCSCEKCEQAWNRQQALDRRSRRVEVGMGLRRIGPGPG